MTINVFVIYDESKAVPQIPSHNKVLQETRSKLTGEHLTQKHDSKKVTSMHLY